MAKQTAVAQFAMLPMLVVLDWGLFGALLTKKNHRLIRTDV
jgi:hypothetical protein